MALSLFAIIRVQVMCGVIIMGSRTSTGEAQQRIPLVVWCHLLQFVFKSTNINTLGMGLAEQAILFEIF